ncbi:hypothetical protein HYX00_06045 [Candidatus Woesearchaeota archaeon]|nr:hypothetical protein [Candidatus Woesearchaeota archaeon]
MKSSKSFIFIVLIILVILIASCSSDSGQDNTRTDELSRNAPQVISEAERKPLKTLEPTSQQIDKNLLGLCLERNSDGSIICSRIQNGALIISCKCPTDTPECQESPSDKQKYICVVG